MADQAIRKGPATTLLRTDGLAVGYDRRVVVAGVELEVRPGQIVTLIGPNGSGKSTILRTVASQLAAVEGRVFLAGRPLEGLDLRERALEVSVLLTDRPRTNLMTCRDVVELGRHPHTGRLGVLSAEDRDRMREAMELTQVWELRDRDFMRLSDGQRQRVLLARAICQEPTLLVLDEPTSYLDIHYQIELLRVLRRLAGQRRFGILMSLHELPLAWHVSDWLVCVKDGAVMAQGRPEDVCVHEVMDELYDLEPGSFDPKTGAVRLGDPWRAADVIGTTAGTSADGGPGQRPDPESSGKREVDPLFPASGVERGGHATP